jgi:hypothetical protein
MVRLLGFSAEQTIHDQTYRQEYSLNMLNATTRTQITRIFGDIDAIYGLLYPAPKISPKKGVKAVDAKLVEGLNVISYNAIKTHIASALENIRALNSDQLLLDELDLKLVGILKDLQEVKKFDEINLQSLGESFTEIRKEYLELWRGEIYREHFIDALLTLHVNEEQVLMLRRTLDEHYQKWLGENGLGTFPVTDFILACVLSPITDPGYKTNRERLVIDALGRTDGYQKFLEVVTVDLVKKIRDQHPFNPGDYERGNPDKPGIPTNPNDPDNTAADVRRRIAEGIMGEFGEF